MNPRTLVLDLFQNPSLSPVSVPGNLFNMCVLAESWPQETPGRRRKRLAKPHLLTYSGSAPFLKGARRETLLGPYTEFLKARPSCGIVGQARDFLRAARDVVVIGDTNALEKRYHQDEVKESLEDCDPGRFGFEEALCFVLFFGE